MIFILLVTVVCLLLIYKRMTMCPPNFPPGPPYLPFMGSALFVPRKYIHITMEKWRYRYGPVVGLFLGPMKAIAVCEPNTVLSILKREEFNGRPLVENLKQRSFGKRLGIVFNDGPQWVEQRRFTFRHLKDLGLGRTTMEGLILDEIEDLLNEMKNKTVQVNGLFGLSTVNMLWNLTAGARYQRHDPKLRELLNGLQAFFRGSSPGGPILAQIFPFLVKIAPKLVNQEFHEITEKLQNFMLETVREHKSTLNENNPRDFIDLYLIEIERNETKQDTPFTEEGLVVLCMDLFTGGAESVSNSLGFTMLYMVLYPEVQEKIQSLIDECIPKNRLPSLEDRTSLPYIDAVLMEVQRINTIAPLAVPRRVLQDTHLNGYSIPKDTFVLCSLWCLLHDKDHWKDPEYFRPSRFLDDDGHLIHDKWLIPFGLGKRACPGESLARNTLFLFLTSILQKFTVVLPPGAPTPSTLSLPGLTVSPQPFEVSFIPRS